MMRVVAFLKALSEHIADGCTTVNTQSLADRLSACDACEYRDGYCCSECGCYLPVKAKWMSSTCPKNRWPQSTTGPS